ncbi:hypothetical protein PRK78_006046 [Emydomyces testavorans]|uniref:F-box domain-containing protein n=1 Tax=Emydomyces testavorans TaxID=2070801 RepID=A0AAF0DLN9_9EURO|nr:hypothetical protein PRK78_006046 [Emydomyces testavorans]
MATYSKPVPQGIYLPTEILSIILSYVQELPDAEKILASCCLISRHWCSVATALLYQRPRITPRNFLAFTSSIVAPNTRSSRKADLGQYVRRLDLSRLVHHSTTSLTSKLLRNVRQKLEVFIAPGHSISILNLPSISKCRKLRILDLSLVRADLTFDEIKLATKNLTALKTLRLPRDTSLTLSANWIPWPPKITTFQFGGTDPAKIPHFSQTFSWPEHLSSLTLHGCKRLSIESIPAIFGTPHLQQNLRRLRITNDNNKTAPRIMSDIVPFIPKVKFLSLPGCDIHSMIPRLEALNTELELEIIELAPSSSTWVLPLQAFKRALDSSLKKLRRLGIHEMHWDAASFDRGEVELDNALKANAERAGYDKAKLESGEILTGYYVFS